MHGHAAAVATGNVCEEVCDMSRQQPYQHPKRSQAREVGNHAIKCKFVRSVLPSTRKPCSKQPDLPAETPAQQSLPLRTLTDASHCQTIYGTKTVYSACACNQIAIGSQWCCKHCLER